MFKEEERRTKKEERRKKKEKRKKKKDKKTVYNKHPYLFRLKPKSHV